MNEVLERIRALKLVPVVTLKSIEDAEPTLSALIKGGLPVAEICFRTECAEEAISLAVQKFPKMLVGAGTVINKEQCERAITAGAKFIVSPGCSKKVAKVCMREGIPYLPGVVTPTITSNSSPRATSGASRPSKRSPPPSRRSISCRRAASAPITSANISLSPKFSPAAAAGW